MTADQVVAAFIGKPFARGGRGPQAFDCWGLVLALRAALALPVPPDFALPLSTPLAVRQRLSLCAPVVDPAPGAIAYSEHYAHAGIVWAGRVVHAARGAGVVAWTVGRWQGVFPDARCYEWRT